MPLDRPQASNIVAICGCDTTGRMPISPTTRSFRSTRSCSSAAGSASSPTRRTFAAASTSQTGAIAATSTFTTFSTLSLFSSNVQTCRASLLHGPTCRSIVGREQRLNQRPRPPVKLLPPSFQILFRGQTRRMSNGRHPRQHLPLPSTTSRWQQGLNHVAHEPSLSKPFAGLSAMSRATATSRQPDRRPLSSALQQPPLGNAAPGCAP